MHTQTVQFAVEKTKNGQIKTIGKSVIEQPKINFSRRSVKWYKDRMKDSDNKSQEAAENAKANNRCILCR